MIRFPGGAEAGTVAVPGSAGRFALPSMGWRGEVARTVPVSVSCRHIPAAPAQRDASPYRRWDVLFSDDAEQMGFAANEEVI